MKNIVFLIGNGFDVGMGLRTQYRDFYELYTHPKSVYYPKDADIRGLAETIDANEPHWSYYEKSIGEYARTFDTEYVQTSSGEAAKSASIYLAQHDHFQTQFYSYLRTLKSALDFSLLTEKAAAPSPTDNHMVKALKDVIQLDYTCKRCKMCNKSTKCKNKKQRKDCQTCLKAGQTGTGNTSKFPEPAEGCKMYSEHRAWSVPNDPLCTLLQEGDFACSFVCYNYSTVLDDCLETLWDTGLTQDKDRVGKYVMIPKDALQTQNDVKVRLTVCHAHGTIGGKPVMGVNDSNQIYNISFSDDPHVLSHMVKEQISTSSHYEGGEELIGNSDVIVIYGMSVGITDERWWDLVLKRMDENPTCQLVIYVYDSSYNAVSPNAHDDIRRAWLARMFSSKSAKNLEVPSNRISFVINNNVFQKNLKKYELYLHEEDQG